MPGKLNALLSLVLALVLFKPLPAIVADEHKIVQTLPLSPKDSHIPRVVAEKRTESKLITITVYSLNHFNTKVW